MYSIYSFFSPQQSCRNTAYWKKKRETRIFTFGLPWDRMLVSRSGLLRSTCETRRLLKTYWRSALRGAFRSALDCSQNRARLLQNRRVKKKPSKFIREDSVKKWIDTCRIIKSIAARRYRSSGDCSPVLSLLPTIKSEECERTNGHARSLIRHN